MTAIGDNGGLLLHDPARRRRDHVIPADYVARFVELAYANTVHGAQGETVDSAHVLIGEHTGASAAYVAMTRGRHHNTAHLVADDIDDARRQWIDVFARDRADLGPGHARQEVVDAIDRYGTVVGPRRGSVPPPPPLPEHRSPAATRADIGP